MTTEDLNSQAHIIASNRSDINALAAEVNDLRDKTKLQAVEIDRRLEQIRKSLPELRLELDRIHQEVQRLTNSVELAQRKGGPDSSLEKKINAELRYIRLRLDRLETTLALAPMKPPAPAEIDSGSVAAPGITEEKLPAETPAAGPEKQLDAARALFEKGLYKAAIPQFNDFIKNNPKSDLTPEAQYYLGECFYQQREYEDAIFEYQKVIKKYSQSRWVSNAMLKQAFSFQAIGDKTTAKLLLEKLVKEYPQTYSGGEAKKRLSTMN